MTEDDYGEGRDPLLVRPFLLRDGGGAPGDDAGASSQTWPAATTREVRSRSALDGADDPTAVLVLPAPSRRDVRRRLVVLTVVGAAVLFGAAAAGFAALRPATHPTIATVMPNAAPPIPAGPRAGSPAPSASAAPSAHRSAGRGAPEATPATAGSLTTAAVPSEAKETTTPATGGSSAAKSPPAAIVPRPATARTGRIRGPGGLCLDVAGGKAADDSRVVVDDCSGADTQSWTLAADGTLRVSGSMCALQVGDGTVHLIACDGRTTAQWSVSDTTLVNESSAGCLTDPGGGAFPGTPVLVTTCTDAANQHWSAP